MIALIRELALMLLQRKKYWLLPLLLALLLVGWALILGASPIAPFIYPLF
jgi:hypothetical protein